MNLVKTARLDSNPKIEISNPKIEIEVTKLKINDK